MKAIIENANGTDQVAITLIAEADFEQLWIDKHPFISARGHAQSTHVDCVGKPSPYIQEKATVEVLIDRPVVWAEGF